MLLGLTYILITVEIYYCRFQMLEDRVTNTSDQKTKHIVPHIELVFLKMPK